MESRAKYFLPNAHNYCSQLSCPPGLKLLTVRELLELVPYERRIKKCLLHLIDSVSHPILGDWSVIVHMTMLLILQPANQASPDPMVESMTRQLWTMLRRYLINTGTTLGVESSLHHIKHCISTLPDMLEHNKEVFGKFV